MTLNQRNFFMMEVIISLILVSNMPNILANPQPGDVITNDHSMELKTIFDKFDDIMKSTNLAGTSTTERDPRIPVICVGSVEELHEIENALIDHGGDHSSESKEISIHISSSCSEFDKMKTGIWKLKNDFHVLIHEKITSSKYVILKSNYVAKMLQSLTHLNVMKTTTSRGHVDNLRNELRTQQNQIMEILTKLEMAQKSMDDDNAAFVISQMQQGRLDVAMAKFDRIIDQDSKVRQIVVSAYGNNEENFKKVVAFVGLITSSPIRITGYKVLHEQMKKHNHLQSENIWILAAIVKNITEPTGSLMEALMEDVKVIVRNSGFDGIVGHINKLGTAEMETVTGLAPFLIRRIYKEKNGSIHKVMNTLQKITSIQHSFVLLNEFITMLRSKDLMHGKEVQLLLVEFIRLKNLSTQVTESQDIALQKVVEKNLPDGLHDLMYKNLCIQNVENDEYLFASSLADEESRKIYTANTNVLDDSFLWQLRFVANGTRVLIKNIKYKEHLYLLNEEANIDDHVHVLRSWISGSGSMQSDKQAKFTLDMVGDGQFLIVNEYFDQLVHSPFESEKNEFNNRPVFSKYYNRDNLLIDSKWRIGLCRVDVEYVF